MDSKNIIRKWNAIGFDAEMFDTVPKGTEFRVRMDKTDVYSVTKEKAEEAMITVEFGDYGKQYAVPLDQFTKK